MKKKRVTMLVTVSVPADLSAADARKNVRSLIKDQCLWDSHIDDGDIVPVSIKPAKESGR